MKTSLRCRPTPFRSFSSSFPAWPTKGSPCLSSWNPGASPTNISSACGLPEPNTTCVRPCASRQRVHPATDAAYAWRSSTRSTGSALTRSECTTRTRRTRAACPTLVAATAGAATAAPAPTADARRLGGAVDGEGRELPRHVRGGAVRARDLLVAADELLEVRLALHADVLVDRHRPESTSQPHGASGSSTRPLRTRPVPGTGRVLTGHVRRSTLTLGRGRTLGVHSRVPGIRYGAGAANDRANPRDRLGPRRLGPRRPPARAGRRRGRRRARPRPPLRPRRGDRRDGARHRAGAVGGARERRHPARRARPARAPLLRPPAHDLHAHGRPGSAQGGAARRRVGRGHRRDRGGARGGAVAREDARAAPV